MVLQPDKINRNLTIATIALVGLHIFLAGVVNLDPPSFRAGYNQSLRAQAPSVQAVLFENRRQELEQLLAPPPSLPWTDERPASDPAPVLAPPPQSPRSEIEPVYFATLPPLSDLENVSSEQRKARFIATVLPLILRANLEIKERRAMIEEASDAGDVEMLKKWAELYRVASGLTFADLKAALLERVDAIPVPIALAQAAIESGWGTSRFAQSGNALYGQWAWSGQEGIRPSQPRFENVVVRSFPNIFESTRAYMHNLNTHPSYGNFRRARARPSSEVDDLVATLNFYSEEGGLYVQKLLNLIEQNDFMSYDQAVLAEQ